MCCRNDSYLHRCALEVEEKLYGVNCGHGCDRFKGTMVLPISSPAQRTV